MGSVRAREVAMGHIDECIQVFQDVSGNKNNQLQSHYYSIRNLLNNFSKRS